MSSHRDCECRGRGSGHCQQGGGRATTQSAGEPIGFQPGVPLGLPQPGPVRHHAGLPERQPIGGGHLSPRGHGGEGGGGGGGCAGNRRCAQAS
eukprot:4672907-Pyramimonas_sp.AAC.1